MKQSLNYDWHTSIYKSDIYEYLKVLERERHIFRRRSPQLQYRYSIIKWLKILYEKVDFCNITLHLAVFLLDHFMDSHLIKPEKLTLVAFICLILAGKFEEQESKIPKIHEMNNYLKYTYLKKDVLFLEKSILKCFDWKLTMPTAVHFAEYYLNYSIAPRDTFEKCSQYEFLFNLIRNTVTQYLDIILEDAYLISYSPSCVAASCILAVRKRFYLEPVWPDQLKNITNYTELALTDCTIHIIRVEQKYQKQRKRKLEQFLEQGYETGKKIRIS